MQTFQLSSRVSAKSHLSEGQDSNAGQSLDWLPLVVLELMTDSMRARWLRRSLGRPFTCFSTVVAVLFMVMAHRHLRPEGCQFRVAPAWQLARLLTLVDLLAPN
jgi:hypothetical protein